MLYLAINNERKGLDNVHVRKAIAYATDKASMIEVGYNGEGFVHDHWINRGQFGWDDNLQVYEYNLDKAKGRTRAFRLQARRSEVPRHLQRHRQGKHGPLFCRLTSQKSASSSSSSRWRLPLSRAF